MGIEAVMCGSRCFIKGKRGRTSNGQEPLLVVQSLNFKTEGYVRLVNRVDFKKRRQIYGWETDWCTEGLSMLLEIYYTILALVSCGLPRNLCHRFFRSPMMTPSLRMKAYI